MSARAGRIVEDVRGVGRHPVVEGLEAGSVTGRVDRLAIEVVVDLVVVDLGVGAGRAHEVAQAGERPVLLVGVAVLADGVDSAGPEARVGVDRVAEEREEVGLVEARPVEHLEVVEPRRSVHREAVGVGRDDEAEARCLVGRGSGDEATELAVLAAVGEAIEVDLVRLQPADGNLGRVVVGCRGRRRRAEDRGRPGHDGEVGLDHRVVHVELHRGVGGGARPEGRARVGDVAGGDSVREARGTRSGRRKRARNGDQRQARDDKNDPLHDSPLPARRPVDAPRDQQR